MEYAFETPDPIEIVVRNAAGYIDVNCETATARTEVVVEPQRPADADAAANTTVVLRGNRLQIEVPEKRWGSSPRITVRVSAPPGSRLVAKTAAADVRCVGTLSALSVTSASGDVAGGRVEGDASVTSASGDITLGEVTGQTRVRTASGDVSAALVASLEVVTASGDVMAGSVCRALLARTASGDVQVPDAVAGTIEVTTASGDILVGVRRGTAVRLDLATNSGDLQSELPVEEVAPERGTTLDLRLHSISGDIQVRRGPASQVA
jgi:DUF4097 and DUF4098 domain-containing protein YvlB